MDASREHSAAPDATSTLIERVQRVDLRVVKLDRALAFYRDVVGLEVVDQERHTASLAPPGGPVLLRLSKRGVIDPVEKAAAGLYHLALRFPGKAELGDALARLIAAGCEIGAGDHGVSEALYVDDPDGNGVELYYDRPRERWPAPGPGERVGMTTAPVDLQALLDAGRRTAAVGDPAPPATEIGHVHLQVSDIYATVPFYVDQLGLDLMQRFGNQAAFFSSNGYHHHIGVNTWRSRGSPPSRRTSAGLDSVVFTAGSEDVLDRTRLRLREYGHRLRGKPGRSLIVDDLSRNELQFVLADPA